MKEREQFEKSLEQIRPDTVINKIRDDPEKLEKRSCKEGPPIHIRHISLKGDRNNNKMERLNGEFRDREKVMRGVKKTDSPIFDGYQIYHNYIRPHMALGNKTLSEACGIKIEGNNKWLTIIQNASYEPKVDKEKILINEPSS